MGAFFVVGTGSCVSFDVPSATEGGSGFGKDESAISKAGGGRGIIIEGGVCTGIEEVSFPCAYKADGGRGVPATAFLKGRVVTRVRRATKWSGLARNGVGLEKRRFDEVDHLGLVVKVLVVRRGEGERNHNIVFSEANVQFEYSWILLCSIIASFEETKMLIPTSVPRSIGTTFVFGGAEMDVMSSGLDPKMLGKISFATIPLFEGFDVEN